MNIYKSPTVLIDERMGIAATLVKKLPQKNVYDLGCGPGHMGMQLWKSDKVYFPHDSYMAFPGVTVVDFNVDFPKIVTPREDTMCVCLGIFEYIFDVPAFINNIVMACSSIVFSYLDVVAILAATGGKLPQGIAPLFNTESFLGMFNKHYSTVCKEALIGAAYTLQNVYYAY